MCNEIASSTGIKCKLSENEALCFIHKKKKIIVHIKSEIKNLNKTIERKNEKIKILDHQIEQKEEHINALNDQIATLLDEKIQLRKENKSMREDFDNYQFIKSFEIIKTNLQNYVNTQDRNELEFFCLQRRNFSILEKIMGTQENYFKHYIEIRHRRNQLSHSIN